MREWAGGANAQLVSSSEARCCWRTILYDWNTLEAILASHFTTLDVTNSILASPKLCRAGQLELNWKHVTPSFYYCIKESWHSQPLLPWIKETTAENYFLEFLNISPTPYCFLRCSRNLLMLRCPRFNPNALHASSEPFKLIPCIPWFCLKWIIWIFLSFSAPGAPLILLDHLTCRTSV